VAATTFPLEDVGQVQEEFFMSGTATFYTSANPLSSDWQVDPVSGCDRALQDAPPRLSPREPEEVSTAR
jgi:hypothetical protein